MVALNGRHNGPTPADREAIRDVICRQLDAFRRDDGDEAFSYASPGIRAMFGTVGVFMRMVREGYPAVYRARSVRFGDLVVLPGEWRQLVHLVGPDHGAVVAVYLMERQSDGAWRIDGCVLGPDDGP
jgi:hypothetical protein